MLIDTHCHLDAAEFDEDRNAVVNSARIEGVSAMVIPAVATNNFAAVSACCASFPGCFPAYGIHPLYLEQASEADFEILSQYLKNESSGKFPPVAVGEIGLDYYVPDFDTFRQEYFFVEQLKIAKDLDLPVLLHVRRAVDQVLKCLRRIGAKGGIAHAFNGSYQQAEEFIHLGFRLGFGGAMTYPGSTRIRKLAATLPLEAIVLETDAPDIPPRWLSVKRNTPAELMRIAHVLAELRSIAVEKVMEITTTNAKEIFGRALNFE